MITLLGQERTSCSARLDPFLSLDQTRTFTYVGLPSDCDRYGTNQSWHDVYDEQKEREEEAKCLFFPIRTGTTFPIELDSVVARLACKSSSGPLEDRVHGSWLDMLNPVHVHLASLEEPPPASQADNGIGSIYRPEIPNVRLDDRWTRLRTFSLDGVNWDNNQLGFPTGEGKASNSVTLTVNLVKEPEVMAALLESIGGPLVSTDDDEDWYFPRDEEDDEPVMKEIVFLVRSIAQADEVRVGIRHGIYGMSIHDGMEQCYWNWERRSERIRFVVVDSE